MCSRFVVAFTKDFCNFVSSIKYIILSFLCIVVNHQMKLNAKHCSLLEAKFQAFLSLRKHTEKNLQKVWYIFLVLRMHLKDSCNSSWKTNSLPDGFFFFCCCCCFCSFMQIFVKVNIIRSFTYVKVISLITMIDDFDDIIIWSRDHLTNIQHLNYTDH